MSSRDLLKLYFGLVYPHLLYGIEIYANTYTSYLNKLHILNNKLLRIILHENIRIPVTDLYKTANVLPIEKLHIYNILLLVHKFIYNKDLLPTIFQNYFVPTTNIHSHNIRSKATSLYIISVSNSRGKRNTKFKAPQLWNTLNQDIKNIPSYSMFKLTPKNHLLHGN